MRYQVDIYGELHTLEDRQRIEAMILEQHGKAKYMFLLLEEIGPHRYVTTASKEKAIADKMYSIGPLGLELSIMLGIPAVGIDLWGADVHKGDKHDENGFFTDAKRSFMLREKRMVEVIERHRVAGRCAVIVGDTHLRTITTRELGGPSLIYKRFKSDRMVKMYRCPDGEIK